ncbi:unnamed protein product [Periconia digitata]|uniref:Expansin-like EG45 domain-containing protein n=1 Tax=Periconia digitata TaxID=1303443 RepID=A0A9W4XQ49_9PLEO|nr:unnamed protein product [Periconia digitata]
MKSFVAILPFVGFALAQDQCGPLRTVTETQIDRVTVTIPAPSSSATDVAEAKISHRPHRPNFPPQPYGNGTFANSTRFPTYTPIQPTTLATKVSALPTEALSSALSSLSSASLKSKSTRTVVVSPVPVTAISSTESVAPSSAPAAAPAPSAAPVEAVKEETSAAAVKGKATFYGGNVSGGHCSFTGYTLPSNLFGTAFGGNWDASQCGSCVAVTGPNGKTIKAMVVDQCPECDVTHLDLFETGFEQIGSKSAGIIDISYTQVPCDITSPIVLKNKEGTSPYFFSMQVVNSNVAISKLEVSTDGGASWKATTRQPYNFFEISGGSGKDTVDVRVTSVGGNTVITKDVSVASGSTKTAERNFSA